MRVACHRRCPSCLSHRSRRRRVVIGRPNVDNSYIGPPRVAHLVKRFLDPLNVVRPAHYGCRSGGHLRLVGSAPG